MHADRPDVLELPMFPLGSVLLPGMVLPLRVFEPRYRVMVGRVVDAEPPELGSVLIERGSEVGGGEVRSDVGCLARVVEVTGLEGGDLVVVAIGTERIRVLEWLPDDPHPWARVQRWPDEDPPGRVGTHDRLGDVAAAVRELGELAGPLGISPTLDESALSDDPVMRTYQLATVSPLGALDRHRVLGTPGLAERLDRLQELLEEQRLLLEARRSFGGDG